MGVYGYPLEVLTRRYAVRRTLHAKNCTGVSDSLAIALKRHTAGASSDSWQSTPDSWQARPVGVTVLAHTSHINSIGLSGLLNLGNERDGSKQSHQAMASHGVVAV